MRILIAEDNQTLRLALEVGIKKLRPGYRVVSVTDGPAALTLLYRQSFDLLLTDNNMPDLKGLELIQKIQPLLPDLPIILMSAQDVIELRAEARQRQLEISGFLGKPFKLAQLAYMIESATNKSSRPDATFKLNRNAFK